MNDTIIGLVKDVSALQAQMQLILKVLMTVLLTSLGALVTNFWQMYVIKKNGFGYYKPCPPKKRKTG